MRITSIVARSKVTSCFLSHTYRQSLRSHRHYYFLSSVLPNNNPLFLPKALSRITPSTELKGNLFTPYAAFHAFSTLSTATSSKLTQAHNVPYALISLIFLAVLGSDPVTSYLLNEEEDVNDSYWMHQHHQRKGEKENNEELSLIGSKASRLRNAEHHDDGIINEAERNANTLPIYSKVVIVGGGMAGLHTALALAEKMNANPSQATEKEDTVESNRSSWRKWFRPNDRNSKMQQRHEKRTAKQNQRLNQNNNKLEQQIIVIDGSTIGNFASGRAKGLVVPGFQVPLEDLEAEAVDHEGRSGTSIPAALDSVITFLFSNTPAPKYTKKIVRDMYDMTYEALDRLRDIVHRYEIDCDWVESGSVEASIHPLEEEEDENLNRTDKDIILSSEQVNEIMGIPMTNGKSLYKGGEYDPSCAGVNPLELTLGLADAAESLGVKIFEYTKAASIERNSEDSTSTSATKNDAPSGRFNLITNEGHVVRCDHVVLCTGAENISRNMSRRLACSFIPIYTWMAATAELCEECPLKDGIVDDVIAKRKSESASRANNSTHDAEISTKKAAPMCGDDHVSLNYWRRTPTLAQNKFKREEDNGGRILFGSLADTYPFPKWLVSWRLRNALTEVYPQLKKVKIDHIWGGKLAFPLDSMPLIGRDIDYDDDSNEGTGGMNRFSDGGVWYATGFAGHGIVPTAMAGSLLANAILGIPDYSMDEGNNVSHHQRWQLFHEYFPPSPWNGSPASRAGAGSVLLVYNLWDWLGKRGVPLPPLPKLW
ncbi:hypothetical protein ACHAXS_009502 [Conticribra weissflogii]